MSNFNQFVGRIFAGALLAIGVTVPSIFGAAFTPGNVVVCRVGDGVAALSSAATPVFIDEYSPAGVLAQTIALPTAVAGANQILTAAGTSTNECGITRSANGNYLIVTGYNAAVGTASVATTTSANFARVIGRIDGNGVVDTTTTTTSFSGGNIRSATSDNGSNFWAVGSVSGVVFNTLGGSGAGTLVSTTATNLRVINVFDGQLYISSGAGAIRSGVIGTGLPTAAGQTATSLPGLPTAAPAAYNGFFFADLSPSVAGPDTLYLASDATVATPPTASSGGILKFSLVGGTWTYNGTFAAVTGPPAISQASFFGLAGTVSSGNVTLFSTKAGQLLNVVDATGYNAAPTGTLAQLATNTANTAFRGLALVPTGGTVTPPVRSPIDFDGDGKTDISIFRPAPGEWWSLRSSTGGNAAVQFGSSTDVLAPADYTGDGKTDIAIFRPSSGSWFILRSEDSSFYAFPFGSNGDVPAPGDFDGDGRADTTVFRPSTNTWFTNRSSGGTTITSFGISGDVPVNADYDGDGRSDIAIFRPGPGEWWIQRSSLGLTVVQFGATGDRTVPGDYTGDGKADVAFFRPSTGTWAILRSENLSFFSFPFGTSSDIPAPGDYDGDAKLDAAVFRPSNSTWFINRSTAGVQITPFGITNDVPLPNVYVR